VILLALVLSVAAAGSTGSSVTYVPPVDAPIIDHFRPPACTWCPGNRGIDYATPPGTLVRASAGGVVTFSGSVAGDRFVVVAHADGLRTTYGYLASAVVVAGDRVVPRQLLGTAGGPLHFGVRRGDVYLDPELLFTTERLVARLVPLDGARHVAGVPQPV
jgi:murein DD-endopeptidase MepM/ murein hydrolase activator NlpD